MKKNIVVILAAGQGKRMYPLTQKTNKCLLPLSNSDILTRLIEQIHKRVDYEINIVVGYKSDKIINRIKKYSNINIIVNKEYSSDINIYSLKLALEKKVRPCFIFEADCIFEDKCMDTIFSENFKNKSIWFSAGQFEKNLKGGIIISDKSNKVIDIKIVDKYSDEFKSYKKMIGVFKVGPNEIEKYYKYLVKEYNISTKQYYHAPWIKNISNLESYLCDLGNLKAASINTIEDYYKAKEMFEHEVS